MKVTVLATVSIPILHCTVVHNDYTAHYKARRADTPQLPSKRPPEAITGSIPIIFDVSQRSNMILKYIPCVKSTIGSPVRSVRKKVPFFLPNVTYPCLSGNPILNPLSLDACGLYCCRCGFRLTDREGGETSQTRFSMILKKYHF